MTSFSGLFTSSTPTPSSGVTPSGLPKSTTTTTKDGGRFAGLFTKSTNTSQQPSPFSTEPVTAPPVEQNPKQNRNLSQTIPGSKGLLGDLFPKTYESLHTPQGKFDMESLKKAGQDFLDTLSKAGSDEVQAFKDYVEPKQNLPKIIASRTNLISKTANLVFSPISAVFSGAGDLPVLGPLSKVLTLPFSVAGEGASSLSNNIIDKLPLSDETKNIIKPGIGEIFSLAAQLYVGKLGEELLPKKTAELETKFSPQDAKVIVEKARELSSNKLLEDANVKGLLESPKEPATQGEGFTISDKTDPKMVKKMKDINTYKEAVNDFNIKPTSEKLKKLEVLRDKIKVTSDENTTGQSPQVTTNPENIGRGVVSEAQNVTQQGVGESGIDQSAGLKVSKIAQDIEAKSIEQGLTKGFKDLAGYDPTTVAEQSSLAAGEIVKGIKNIKNMLNGVTPLPEKLTGSYFIKAVEDHLLRNPDPELAYELANSHLITGTSIAAQELRMAAERDPYSGVSMVSDLNKARDTSFSEKMGRTVKEAKDEDVKSIKENIKKRIPKKDVWKEFVREIECGS